MDYRGDRPYEDCNTPGLIVDDVSFMNDRVLCLLIRVLGFLRPCMNSWWNVFLPSVA
jgi:hypothetical protein